MRILLFFTIICISFSCSEKKLDPDYKSSLPERFGAVTLRGNSIIFNDPEAGIFNINEIEKNKLLEIDEEGNPKYSTSDIIKEIYITNKAKIENNGGFFIRFSVPKIKDNDYVIINSVITPPQKIEINGTEFKKIESSYKYSSENSKDDEYIYFMFSEEFNKLKIPGKWKISLFNHNNLLASEEFNLTL